MGTGIIDAASVGAISAISIVAYILASVIAFFSLLEFLNATLQWFGDRVGLSPPDYPPLSFEVHFFFLIHIFIFNFQLSEINYLNARPLMFVILTCIILNKKVVVIFVIHFLFLHICYLLYYLLKFMIDSFISRNIIVDFSGPSGSMTPKL